MRLPATTYQHSHHHDRRGSNTGVSPHCFTTHPVMGVKPVTIHTLPCTVYHQSHSREDTTRPVFRDLGDSALSVRHRPGLDPASTPDAVRRGRKAGVAQSSGSCRRLIPDVTMMSRDGRPFLEHAATATPTGTDKTSPQGSPVSWPPPTL
jgi:hypothetical protein